MGEWTNFNAKCDYTKCVQKAFYEIGFKDIFMGRPASYLSGYIVISVEVCPAPIDRTPASVTLGFSAKRHVIEIASQ